MEPLDPVALHGRVCRCCDGSGRIRVEVSAALTAISCDRCGATGRAICASFNVPLSAVLGAVARFMERAS